MPLACLSLAPCRHGHQLPLDVLDDFEGEAKEVHGTGNSWLAYSPALHMLRESGTLIGLLDLLDERPLRPGEVRRALIECIECAPLLH